MSTSDNNLRHLWSHAAHLHTICLMSQIFLSFLIITFPVLTFAMENNSKIDKMEYFALKDQYGNFYNIDDNIRLIIFTKDKESSDIAHNALKVKNQKYLFDHGTVFISDISLMPGFVYKKFALPEIKKYSYLMLLIDKPEKYYKFPYKKGEITLLSLEKMRIKSIKFVCSPLKLLEIIEQ